VRLKSFFVLEQFNSNLWYEGLLSQLKGVFNYLGPGFIIAATGVGAGDMVAATVAGSSFGTTILWAVVVGAAFKFVLNEGIARWQLTTQTSILNAWITKIHPTVSYLFLVYLILWSFIVAGALMAACGLAAHSIFPQMSITAWGIIHSLIAVGLIFYGRYALLENIMKAFICLMFLTILTNLFLADLDWSAIAYSFISPKIPAGSVKFILGMIGGVGGSVTLLCYGYWMKEKGWNSMGHLKKSRIDLSIAYLFTGVFGLAIVILASGLSPEKMSGNQIVISLADKIMITTGIYGKWIFLVGFWGAVFSSMLGVWNGVPYIFNEFVTTFKMEDKSNPLNETTSKYYRYFLAFLAFPPMCLLFLDKPVWIIIIYSVAGAFFMPFLAATLLFLNNKMDWIRTSKNSKAINIILICTLILFLYLLWVKLKTA
jgi:Mn2+/Fe2+ NRAMP family transporter